MTKENLNQSQSIPSTNHQGPLPHDDRTLTYDPSIAQTPAELNSQFTQLLHNPQLNWQVSYRLVKKIGEGGQGVVYLANRIGSHDVSFPLAIKIFSPASYESQQAYDQEMSRLARVCMQLAKIQQDHLLDLHNMIMSDGIELMMMEWVQGYDLAYLMQPGLFDRLQKHVPKSTWEYINDVIATRHGTGIRIKPGVAIAILRDCFSGIAAMHENRIVHADLKPSNIMVKLTGHSKVIDFGSAYALDDLPRRRTWTPRYAAPELLLGSPYSCSSDLASLGYVLLEMLSGENPVRGATSLEQLAEMKLRLPDEIEKHLSEELKHETSLIGLIGGLIASQPDSRFPSATAADLEEVGAAHFHRHLVKADLSSEYEHDLKFWLAAVLATEENEKHKKSQTNTRKK